MKYRKLYPYSLIENGYELEHAKSVLVKQDTPDANEKIKRINKILAKESHYNPNTVWLTGPELDFVKQIIKETSHLKRYSK